MVGRGHPYGRNHPGPILLRLSSSLVKGFPGGKPGPMKVDIFGKEIRNRVRKIQSERSTLRYVAACCVFWSGRAGTEESKVG